MSNKCKHGMDHITNFCRDAYCGYSGQVSKEKYDQLKVNLTVCKNDYWFMINLLEKFSTDKDQAIKDCIERMKFRKALFNILEDL